MKRFGRLSGHIAGLSCSIAVCAGLSMPAGAAFTNDTIAVTSSDPEAGIEKKVVYHFDLTGVFAKDITQTPIREVIKDAKEYKPDYIIITLNNTWDGSLFGGLREVSIGDSDITAFDQLFRAEDIEPILTREIPAEWDKQPIIVYWVKQAMGGAAFLPFSCSNIYMTPDARIGGIGGMDELFDGVGDEVVREKQRSLRMGHARGMFIQGGYDTRVCRAMAERSFVLSYTNTGGKTELLERMPQGPTEFLLTDDGGTGEQGSADSMEDEVRQQGDDHLTLKADTALYIGVSKGTAANMQQLLFQLGIDRNSKLVEGSGNRIMQQWRDAVKKAPRQLQDIAREYQQAGAQTGNDVRDRRRAISTQIRKLKEMESLIKRYEEAIGPELGRYGIPDLGTIGQLKVQHELQLLILR